MQNLVTVEKSEQTAKLNKLIKKGKVGGNTSKTGKNKAQFTEILGQLALTLQPTKITSDKQSEISQPETSVNKVKTVQSGAGGVTAKEMRSESTASKIEAKRAQINIRASVQSEKSSASATAGEVAPQADINQLRNIASLPAASEKITQPNKLEQVNTFAQKNSETITVILGSTENSSANTSEIKIADLIIAKNMQPSEKTGSQTAKQDLLLQAEASSGSVKSAHSGSGGAINNGENTPNGDGHQGAGTETTGPKTQTTTEFSLNAVAGENGALKSEIAEDGGINGAKTMLSKSQTDYLVSKMVQQINVAPSSLEVTLKPEYLGKVNILVQSVEGAVTVHVIAQNSEAMNLLNSNLPSIKDSLQQLGIHVGQLEVNLGFQEKQDSQSGGYKGEPSKIQELENYDSLMDYGSIPSSEQGSLSSYQLNLLA